MLYFCKSKINKQRKIHQIFHKFLNFVQYLLQTKIFFAHFLFAYFNFNFFNEIRDEINPKSIQYCKCLLSYNTTKNCLIFTNFIKKNMYPPPPPPKKVKNLIFSDMKGVFTATFYRIIHTFIFNIQALSLSIYDNIKNIK